MTASLPSGADRDWWVIGGMTVAAASAAVGSFSGLYGLAILAGWPVRLAWLLPLTVDAYAMTSARVWLAASTRSAAARRFARANALGAIAASITGNAAYHAVETRLLVVSWPIVVIVGAVPAAVLGLTAHLHALRGRVEYEPTDAAHRTAGTDNGGEKGPETVPASDPDATGTEPSRRVRPTRSDDELISQARAADRRHREKHGRPISRDGLRSALKISGGRATELRRRLAAEAAAAEQAPAPEPPDHAPTDDREEVKRL